MIHAAFGFRRSLQKQEATPVILMKLIPLCSGQYERMFNTTRIPGETTDTLQSLRDATHVVVMCGGKYYRLACYRKGKLLEPAALQA